MYQPLVYSSPLNKLLRRGKKCKRTDIKQNKNVEKKEKYRFFVARRISHSELCRMRMMLLAA
jgi:hypothetical protein